MSIDVDTNPTTAEADERAVLRRIEAILERDTAERPPSIVDADGMRIPLPETLLQVMRSLVHYLAQDRPVAVVPFARELTTQQAADILHVSRPFLISQLLDKGEIPFAMTGAHRRIAFDDLMDYKRRRDVARHTALGRLSRMSQEMGLE